ncbi:hypothetical protein [Sphingomonas sp. BK345]|uniref:hypothetical protein n=1 Tax=Sphingomonas sp. BK345 TaxID=2586980 RepID=UPI00160E709E|nr:hypothetical protein [Sphingomonas sp. BK345]MBB3474258.1 hypothetical protein [Sphingomonas sp. BK345]
MNNVLSLSRDAVEFAAFAGSFLIPVMAVALYAIYRQQRFQIRSNEEHQNAMFSLMRASYEEKIADMNQRLLATEERFRDVNHLIIDSQRSHPASAPRVQDSEVSIGRFLTPFGIQLNEISVDPKLVFVLTPFSQKERVTYKAIQDVANRLAFRTVKSDDEFISGEILPHVVRLIVSARFIVANISGRNPNVYYELGIAHALGKPTILVAPTLDSVPFDLQSKYIVLFENLGELREKLRDAITHILSSEGVR